MTSKRLNIAILLAAVIIAFFSCDRDRRDFNVATAGSTSLKSKQLAAIIPEGFESQIGDDALVLVSQWTDEIVLAEAANDVGLTDLPEVAAKLDEARRMILASAYEQFYLLPNTSVDSSEVWAYYQEHSEEFVRSNDEVLLDHIMFSDTAFKDSVVMLLDSLGFEELAERFGLGQEGYSIGSTEYLSKKQIHASIARKAFALAEGEMAGPIKTEFGYHFIRLVDFAPKGSLREFSEVSLSIRDFISEQKFQELYSSVLDSLRSVKAVTIDTNAVKEALAKHEK